MQIHDPMDKEITCGDCGETFWHTKKAQDFFKEKGLSEPKRCKKCREIRKQNKENGGGYGNRRYR